MVRGIHHSWGNKQNDTLVPDSASLAASWRIFRYQSARPCPDNTFAANTGQFQRNYPTKALPVALHEERSEIQAKGPSRPCVLAIQRRPDGRFSIFAAAGAAGPAACDRCAYTKDGFACNKLSLLVIYIQTFCVCCAGYYYVSSPAAISAAAMQCYWVIALLGFGITMFSFCCTM